MPDTHTFSTKIAGPDEEYSLCSKIVEVHGKAYRVTRSGLVESVYRRRDGRIVGRSVAFYGPAAASARRASGWFK